jgi:hypothetical protein
MMRLREKSQLKKNQYKIQFLTNPILKDEIGKKKLIKKKTRVNQVNPPNTQYMSREWDNLIKKTNLIL